MMGHKICFYEEICIIIPILSLLLLLILSTVTVLNSKERYLIQNTYADSVDPNQMKTAG